MTKKEILFLVLVVVLFLTLRLPGLHLPYHLDETKYAVSVSVADHNTPHPPVSKIILLATAKIFGRDNFRATPLIFSLANLFLLYYLVRFQFGRREARWSVLLFAIVFYNVLGSLTVDFDGAILPFWLLLSLISYFKWQTPNETARVRSVLLSHTGQNESARKRQMAWGGLLTVAVIFGFLTKLSFIIVAGALVLDWLIGRSFGLSRRELRKYVLTVLALPGLLIGSLWGIKFLWPSFDLARTLSHATDYFKISGRAYLQILIQSAKALIYASPLLAVPLIFLKKTDWRRLSFFVVFLVLGLIFYLIIFDFSRAALDKYLVFIVVPLVVMSGVGLTNVFSSMESTLFSRSQKVFFWGVASLFLGAIFLSQFVSHFAPALYPKEEWISRMIKLKWNFVFPFTGGSGPLGLYVSWLFMVLVWLASIFLALWAFLKRPCRRPLTLVILLLGLLYNLVFAEEYLFGKINGSSRRLLAEAVDFIKQTPAIKSVITYNNFGQYELTKIGKYERRLLAAPKYEGGYVDVLKNFKGHYLVVDIPHLDPNSPYAKHFQTCRIIYEQNDRKISSTIYDCRNPKIH